MKLKQLAASLYAIFLFIVGILTAYSIGPSIIFNENFWGYSQPAFFTTALLQASMFILFEAYLLYLGVKLLQGKYPKFLVAWIAAPYILLAIAAGLFAYVLANAEF